MSVAGGRAARVEQLARQVVVIVVVWRNAGLGRIQEWARVAHDHPFERVRAASVT